MTSPWVPAALLLLAPVPQASEAPPAFERGIELRTPGPTAVRLDRDVYEGARADLGDVRVVDDRGASTPFVVDRGEPRGGSGGARAAIRNHAWGAERELRAVLDFGGRVRKSRLRLELSGDNFRRRVAVEGSEDGATWVTLVDEAWVFAVPGDAAARYETVALPENDFRHLRVTVHPGDGERQRVVLSGAQLPGPGAEPPENERALEPSWSSAVVGDARETWLSLDLGARHQPFHALELAIADERFFRELRVEARREPPAPSLPVRWVEIGRGVLYRLEHQGRRRENLRLDVSGRERALRVRIRNGDDRPLTIRRAEVRVPVERLAFEAEPGRSYRLTYGAPALGPPSFDLARTIADPLAWADQAGEAALGPVHRTARSPGAALPWTERHPALLWSTLVAVVLALGALTIRALRKAS